MDLLPEMMGPMETLMWGRGGLMRGMGFPLTEESRKKELKLRQAMLTAHRVGGFLTLAAMTGTVIAGQLLINSEKESGEHAGHGQAEEHDHGIHTAKVALTWTTVGLYTSTMLLAVLSPPPMFRSDQWSRISWHKSLAVGHFTGMFVTPILGLMIEDNHDAQVYHQVTGYATLALLAGAMVVVTF